MNMSILKQIIDIKISQIIYWKMGEYKAQIES